MTDEFIAVGAATGQVEVRNRDDGQLVGQTIRTAPVSFVEIVGDELLVGDRALPELARLALDPSLTQTGSLTHADAPQPFANNFGIFAGAVAENGDVTAAAYGPFGDIFLQRTDGPVEAVRLGDGRTGIQTMSISPDGTTLAAVRGGSGVVELWNLDALDQQGRALDTLFGQTLVLGFIDAQTLVIGGTGGWLQLWDVATGEAIGSPVRAHDSDLVGVTINRQQRSMITSSTSSVVWWNLEESTWPRRLCLAAGRPLSESEWQRFVPDREYRRTCDEIVEGE
ncbi:MAG: WD40 repeat domain-containing protein [Actinomycetota bacterium]